MIELAIILLALVLALRYNKWQLITGEHSVKNFFRHELTEVKAFFKD